MARVLIVDDQIDVRRVLRSGIETLGPEIEIVDMPSGEEAFLEALQKPVDLLIADVRLAGISGFELRKKIQSRYPQVKTILITGIPDVRIRREVADAKAEVFFYKPIPMDEFLKAVERCLGLVKPGFLQLDENRIIPIQGLMDRLARLRQEINAISALLLNEQGEVLVSAGDLPDAAGDSQLIPALLRAFQASADICRALGAGATEDLLCCAGAKFDLALVHIGPAHALLAIIDKSPGSEYWSTLGFHAQLAARDLLKSLGTGPEIPPQKSEPASEPAPAEATEPPVSAQELEALLQTRPQKALKTDELNAYWEAFAVESDTKGSPRPDALTFEEAQQLGLTPDSDAG
jgi:DNA-binding NarL/FixJ family response regulator